MRTFVLVLFSIAWAAVGFAVIRAVVIAWGYHRRLATATAFAVAAAFALGAASPFSLVQRFAPAPSAPVAQAGVPHPIACPAGVKVAANPGQGHIDALSINGTQVDVTKPIALASSTTVRLGGWVVAVGGPTSGFCVLVDGRPVAFEGLYGLDRPDVATALNKPEDRGSGFEVSLRLPRGSHVVTVGPMQADGSLTPLQQAVTVQVR